MKKKEVLSVLSEFVRYAIVGGIAFLVDTGVLVFFREIVFKSNGRELIMAVSVAFGFLAGLTVNYILSLIVVFRSPEQRKRGKRVTAFITFALVGLVGLGLTELGMYIGVKIVGSQGLWYLLIKCFVAGIVLIWNYTGKKILVFSKASDTIRVLNTKKHR